MAVKLPVAGGVDFNKVSGASATLEQAAEEFGIRSLAINTRKRQKEKSQ